MITTDPLRVEDDNDGGGGGGGHGDHKADSGGSDGHH